MGKKEYEILKNPVPHILVDSKKEMHGWSKSYEPNHARECTAERLLVNPYNGCSNSCCFCYANAMGYGYFSLYLQKKIITVFKDFDKQVAKQLDKISIGSCGYLSAATDPFQKINEKYRLSEKIIAEFNKRNLPIEIITKSRISDEAIELLKQNKYNFAQVTILTPNENIRQKIIPHAADTKMLNENIDRLVAAGVPTVVRIDPIIPGRTDKLKDLEFMIKKYANKGVKHIITSVLDIPTSIKQRISNQLSEGKPYFQEQDFPEKIFNDLNKSADYRRSLFNFMRMICENAGITFALCMEFELTEEKKDGKPVLKGMNAEFMTSRNCEGIDTPIHIKKDGRFEPVQGCDGACLKCDETSVPCSIPELQKAGKWKLKDYRRWSRWLDNLKF